MTIVDDVSIVSLYQARLLFVCLFVIVYVQSTKATSSPILAQETMVSDPIVHFTSPPSSTSVASSSSTPDQTFTSTRPRDPAPVRIYDSGFILSFSCPSSSMIQPPQTGRENWESYSGWTSITLQYFTLPTRFRALSPRYFEVML